uniref:Coiled-coil domain-containing protein 12 n=1 Tax=Ananas comosus var. bracteatus TaxID=296719 RepID=A0A6V7PIM4_ANACO|nr:unnamed protein product [Ananas comosus var. bracteatus]
MVAEEDAIDQASSARRERLRALRAAKEYSSTPDEGSVENEGNSKVSGEDREERTVTSAEDDSIEQAAAARHERLKALRTAKELLETPDDGLKARAAEDSEETEDNTMPNMKFRNYLPHDKQLQEGKLAPVVLSKFEDPIATAPIVPEKTEDPFMNIAPKKPNWDLRRDVQKKLDKLERRTQKALYQLMLQEKEKEAAEAVDDAMGD